MSRIRMKNEQVAKSGQTFAEIFETFVGERMADGVQDKTIKTYRNHLQCISHHFDTQAVISDVKQSNIDEMVISMRQSGLASASISSYTRVMGTFLNWCDENNYCHLTVPKYKTQETVKETYTDEEIERLLKRPSPTARFSVFRTWVIINFLLNAGCRASTVRGILNCDVDLRQRQIMSRHNKNGRVQTIPLCGRMVAILREYMNIRGGGATDFLFCDEFGNELSETALRQAVARYNRARGVEKTSLHMFRHTFARKYLVDCGGNAFTLQKILGHSTLKMTKHYCAIFDADIAKQYDRYSPLEQFNRSKERIHRA